MAKHGLVNIIDIGGTVKYWDIIPKHYLQKHNVNVTIVNLAGTHLPKNNSLFTFIHGDGCNLSMFRNNIFHIAHSNSVIEHVGDWNRMVKFSKEARRVARRHFIQTPNYWFPIEPHCLVPFFHWLPKPIRMRLVMKFSLGHWRKATSVHDALSIVKSANLLNRKMFSELFSDSTIVTEKIACFSKSFIAVRE